MCLIIPKNLLNDYLLSSSLLENSRHFCCWNKSCKQCIHLDAYTHSKKRLKNGNCGRMRLYKIWIVCIHKNAVDPWKFKDSDLNTQHIWSKNGLTMQKIAKNSREHFIYRYVLNSKYSGPWACSVIHAPVVHPNCTCIITCLKHTFVWFFFNTSAFFRTQFFLLF